MSEYNVNFLNYKSFFDKYENKILNNDKKQIEEINNDCLNKNFFYMLLWQKWIQEPNTVSYYIYDKDKAKYSPESTKTSLNSLKLFPYKKDKGMDILPIIDIRKIFIILNFGKENSSLNSIYDFIFTKLNNEKISERLDAYIDQPYNNFQKSVYGLYFDIILNSGENRNDYIDDLKYNNEQIVIEDKYTTNFTFEKITNNSTKKRIDEINLYDFNKLQVLDEYDLVYKIDVITSKIVKFVQFILDYISFLYRLLTKDENPPIDLKNLFPQPPGTSIPIDRMLELIGIKPKFKKSYIARENNLFGYVKIKMIKNIKNFGYLEIDNFGIPYNQILDFEYDVGEQTVTLKLIDTEGNLSELLINKMYSFFNNNVKDIAQTKQDEIAQYFEIEYGWAGPVTENIVELLKENIFTKKIFRGYIKSISSEFSSNGTTYEIKISPNPFKKNASINTYDVFFENSTKASISLILIFSYLILKNFTDDVLEDFNRISDKNFYTADSIFLEKIFYILLEKDFYIRPNKQTIKKKTTIISYSFGVVSGIDEKKDIYQEFCTIDKQNNNIDFNLIELLINNLKINELDFFIRKDGITGNKKEKIELFYIKNMKVIDNDGITSAMESASFWLNAWTVGIFLTLKLKDYFLKTQKKFFVFYDITTIFDVFNLDPKQLNSLDKNKTLNSGIRKYVFFNNTLLDGPPLEITEKELLRIIKDQYKQNNSFNRFKISVILEKDPKYEKRETINYISFFTSTIEKILERLENYQVDIVDLPVSQTGSVKGIFQTFDKTKINEIKDIYEQTNEDLNYKPFLKNIENTAKYLNVSDNIETEVNVLFLSFALNHIKIFKSDSVSVENKVKFLSDNIVQSYSLTPRIYPKTRNSNKQFFSQGNDKLLSEGTGDIIEFVVNKMDIENIMMASTINKNQKNIGFNSFSSHSFSNGIYENAAKYYNTYTDINGETDKSKIASDMASLQAKYRNQIQISGNITIFGEPYWSDINLLKSKYIYLNIYYSNGTKSAHSGLYMVTNTIHNITNGKYTTKIEIIRQNTFLSNFSIKGESNTNLV